MRDQPGKLMERIVRVFRVKPKAGQEAAMRSFFLTEALRIVRAQEGLVSVQVGLPMPGAVDEFLMITTWESLDALKRFAGDQWSEAVIDPAEASLILETSVVHFVEAKEARSVPTA